MPVPARGQIALRGRPWVRHAELYAGNLTIEPLRHFASGGKTACRGTLAARWCYKGRVTGTSQVLITIGGLYGLWFKEGHSVWLDAPGGLLFDPR